MVIERDGTQGNLNGFKAIYQIGLPQRFGEAVEKTLLVDLLRINDPFRISGMGLPGDVGLGEIFAFPSQPSKTCWYWTHGTSAF
jgi:glycerophosphoryl diester phosphodiesterase